MKFKYVNPKAVKELVGKYAPVDSFILARLIEEVLDNTNQGYVYTSAKRRLKSEPLSISEALVGISDKLLQHNVRKNRGNEWDFYSGLDFDIVHQANGSITESGEMVNTEVKAYFYHTEYARPPEHRRVVFHMKYNNYKGTEWAISFPIQVVMKGFHFIEGGHVGYAHGICLLDKDGKPQNPHNKYIGITKRNWLQRMHEHFREIENGGHKTFHSAWREYAGRNDVLLTSELVVMNHNYEQIMAWEEVSVDEQMDAGTSLNMIPGGFKGAKFLYKHKLTQSENISLEERDIAIRNYQAQNPRLGVPNLLISELWKDQEYAEKVICGVEGRLSIEQVKKIRELNMKSIPIEKIVEVVNAKNLLQVERVIRGETYSRIH